MYILRFRVIIYYLSISSSFVDCQLRPRNCFSRYIATTQLTMATSVIPALLSLALTSTTPSALAFQLLPTRNHSAILPTATPQAYSQTNIIAMASSATSTSAGTESAKENDKNYLYIPSERDAHYRGNIARYLLDLHEEKATFDFCGGEHHPDFIAILVFLFFSE